MNPFARIAAVFLSSFLPIAATSLCLAAPITVTLGTAKTLPNTTPGVPRYPYFPDGHIAMLPNGDGTNVQMYWAGDSSYRTVGTTIENMAAPGPAVLTAGAAGSYDNGGAWLYSVTRTTGNNLLGFYHAEDHEFGANPNPGKIAWKSLAVATSANNGVTWTKQGQIITSSTPKPATPTWGGNGDSCIIYDSANSRWVAFYQEHFLMTAVSTDPNGAPGTWKKYYNGSFTEAGLGGRNSPIPSLQGYAGGNPSVTFNSALNRWVMVWHTWEGHSPSPNSIYLSTSTDLFSWETPQLLLAPQGNARYWYPTILDGSDVTSDADAILAYAYWPDKNQWQRQPILQPIHFQVPEPAHAAVLGTASLLLLIRRPRLHIAVGQLLRLKRR